MRNRRSSLLLSLAVVALAVTASATRPPCLPCAGIEVNDPLHTAELLAAEPRLEGEARLYVSWRVELDDTGQAAAAAARLQEAGATPWLAVVFRTGAPVAEHLEELGRELEAVAELAGSIPDGGHFQVLWEPANLNGALPPVDYAFLLKRAAVAISGAQASARVLTAPMPADPAVLRQLYAEEVAAYIDGIALADDTEAALASAISTLNELDAGRPVVVNGVTVSGAPERSLVVAAEQAAAGVSLTLLRMNEPTAGEIQPLKVLAREMQGELSIDPGTSPQGATGAWTFVRADDLSLRVIAEVPVGQERLDLRLPDRALRDARLIDVVTGEKQIAFGQQRTDTGFEVPLFERERPVVMLQLERMSAAELGGFDDQVAVVSDRTMPVEEILRRLQAFEDAQNRRLDHYQAINTAHMRFRLGTGQGTLEATFAGDFFFRQGTGFDWVWSTLFINGVRWRGALPEIPLIQPAKAAALPLEIHLSKEYSYRLRGTDQVAGRDCWVVDFEPVESSNLESRRLHQGTVWIDRQLYARVKSRALQLGLTGEVLSNEETIFYQPVDAQGQPAQWQADSYLLPTRIVGQQLLSILNAVVQVEKESMLTEVAINGGGFEQALQRAYTSQETMLRDTDQGLRYLVKDPETGERQVQEGFDLDRFAWAAGTYYDDSLDYPLPLAGIDYFSGDFRGSGNQVNLLFAGIMTSANIAEPSLFGSRWDAGANLFAFFLPLEEELYRQGEEVPSETVERRSASVRLFLGHPIGSFGKLDFTYGARFDAFGRADDTADDFVIPTDTVTHQLGSELSFNRGGYQLALAGTYFRRSDWQPWGLPGNPDYDPEHRDYQRWRASFTKTWWLPKFMKLGLKLEHLDGADLDRFSKYDFSFFADASVAGYQGGLVTASEANGAHLTYGLNLGEVIRFELGGDAVWATDELTGLDNELLAGVGLSGTLVGPWQTIINFNVGYPVQGPADGPVISLIVLKLMK